MINDKIINLTLGFIGILLFLGLTSLLVEAQINSATIGIDSATVTITDEFDVSIHIEPAEGNRVGALTTEVTYDETIVEVLSCAPVNMVGVCNFNELGNIKVASFHTTGIQEKTDVVTIKLRAINSTPQVSPLTLTTSLLGNVDGEPLTIFVDVPGQVTILNGSYGIYLPILRAP